MLKRKSLVSNKFVLSISITYSILILIFSFSFLYLLKTNKIIISETLLKNNNYQLLNKIAVITESLKSKKISSLNELSKELYLTCSKDYDFLNILLLTKTSDDNYFKIKRIIRIDPSLKINIKKNNFAREAKAVNYLNKGLFKGIIDPKIYISDNHYYQNIYYPFKIKNNNLVIEYTVSSSRVYSAINEYLDKIETIKNYSLIITAGIIITVIIITFVNSYNFILVLKKISKQMKKAAEGKLDVSLSADSDADLGELALSFNSLVSELKELKEKDKIINDPEKKDSLTDIFKIGVDLLKEENYDDAEAVFKALTILKPNAFGSNFNLGVVYAKKKDYRKSRLMFEKALKANPDHELTLTYIKKVKKLLDANEKNPLSHQGKIKEPA